MLMIPVDEAFAFDLLSILQIKATHGLKVLPEIAVMEYTLRMALGREKCRAVTESEEYLALADANRKMWEIQEWSMRDMCKAESGKVPRKAGAPEEILWWRIDGAEDGSSLRIRY